MPSPEQTSEITPQNRTATWASWIAGSHAVVEGGLIVGAWIEAFTTHAWGPLGSLALIEAPIAFATAVNLIRRKIDANRVSDNAKSLPQKTT